MNIEIEFKEGYLKLEVDILSQIPYEPSRLTGHPDTWQDETGGEIDYNIISALPLGFSSLSVAPSVWYDLDTEDKSYYLGLFQKANELRRGYLTEIDYALIDEAIWAGQEIDRVMSQDPF